MIADAIEGVSVSGSTGPYIADEVAALSCDFVDGYPDPSFEWFKDGTVIAGETSQTIEVTAVNTDDGAVFSCEASNVINTVTSSNGITLRVDSKLGVYDIRV